MDEAVDDTTSEGTGGPVEYAVHAARVLDPSSNLTVSDAYVLIHGRRIAAIAAGRPPNVPVIDLGESTLLPGLIDCHTHLLLRPEDQIFPPAITFKSIPYRAIEGTAAARSALHAGFTTVRDTGNEQAWHCDCALRDAITAGAVAGPRMFVATDTLSITGGDMRLDDRVNRELRLPELAEIVDTRDDIVRAVRRQVRNGADWIKVYATSTQMDLDPVTMEPLHQFNEDEIRLIVGEAKRFRRDVAAHAYGGAGALAAIRGGVRSLEHGPLLTDADIAAMVEEGTYWVPTLSTYRKLGPYWEKQPAEFHQRFVERHRSSFERAWAAGVKIAFGTDVGSFPHGEQRYEFELLVEYGMTPVEALTTATSTAAALLRRAGELGTLTAGAVADLVAVSGDPTTDISAINNTVLVVRDGIVQFDPAGLLRSNSDQRLPTAPAA